MSRSSRVINLTTLFAFAGLVAACGSDPLTDEQKARLTATFSDVSETGGTVNSKARDAKGMQHASSGNAMAMAHQLIATQPQLKQMPAPLRNLFGGFLGMSPAPTGMQHTAAADLPPAQKEYLVKRASKRKENMKNVGAEMAEKFMDGSCSIPESDLMQMMQAAKSNPDVNTLTSVKFRIEGANCPIFAEFRMSDVKAERGNASGKFGFTFEVKDAELQKFAECKRVSVDAKISATGSETESSMEASIEGSLTTLTEGDITFNMSGNVEMNKNGMTAESNATIKFKDFTVELESNMNSKGESKLVMNGEEVTPEQMASLMSGGLEAGDLAANEVAITSEL